VRRLCLATVDPSRLAIDPRELRIGVMHLGIGAFHRAHQAVFTELAAAATGRREWGIAAATGRSPSVREQLAPQDGLYSVLERGPDGVRAAIIGSVREVIDGASGADRITARIAEPDVRVVTLTVTEKGYRRGPDGGLDLTDPLLRADLAGGPASGGHRPATAIGRLVAGLRRRHADDAGPLTVLSCDNLVGNGAVLRRLVHDFTSRETASETDGFPGWLESSVRFPATMVDRIVPATTAADLAEARDLIGLDDAGTVVTEPFSQWVIENDFAADRPPWEAAGARLTADVAPWEAVKLRLLNGSHSALAYLGALRGHRTIAESVRDPELAALVGALMRDDAGPTLTAPDGLDLAAYRASVLERFANPALRHTTAQVAADGSQKLPLRLLGTIAERLAAGVVPAAATLAVAGWMSYVAAARDGRFELVDPRADELRRAAAGSGAAAVVDGLLGVRAVFGTELPEHRGWRDELVAGVRRLS
jgi:fructuronate reductase